jgi:hypothetical protein
MGKASAITLVSQKSREVARNHNTAAANPQNSTGVTPCVNKVSSSRAVTKDNHAVTELLFA